MYGNEFAGGFDFSQHNREIIATDALLEENKAASRNCSHHYG